MDLSIIIPAYNEAERIGETLEKYTNHFDKILIDYEIIVVLNCCSDNTPEVVDKFKVKQILTKKKGKGLAVHLGFKFAKGNYIGFTDADGSLEPEDFFGAYSDLLISDKDGIVGIRKDHHYISSFLFKCLVKTLFDFGIKDTQCALKIFKRDTATLLVIECWETGWMFDIEMLQVCKAFEKELIQIPVDWNEKEGSKLNTMAGIFAVFKVLSYRFGSNYQR